MTETADAKQALKQIFGYETFRPYQEEIVEAILQDRDGFVVMPTGGGKSLCFQLPAHMKPGTCVVISPLISLMKDQVDAATETGLRAACLNSTMAMSEQNSVLNALRAGQIDLLYVAPERFAVNPFVEALKTARLSFFAIDEAHCISEWGHDFRPDYGELSTLVTTFPEAAVIAFTATATLEVQNDIVKCLGLRDPFRVRASFNRPNLFYGVTPKYNVESQVLAFIRQHPAEPGIVYRTTRKATEETAAFLKDSGLNVVPYHAGMSDHDRAVNQEAFRRDDVQAVVATVAFGMGIDKPNVRWVVHGDLPKNIESYYQETGRAGRDGDPAHCHLFFSGGDAAKIEYFINQCENPEEKLRLRTLLRAMMNYASSNVCRRRTLLTYFGEQFHEENCGTCDVCQGDVQTVDATTDARKILSAAVRSKERFGGGHLVDIVYGANTERIRRNGHDRLPTYGVGSDQPKKHWHRVVDELICQQCLQRSNGEYATLSMTGRGWSVMKGEETFRMAESAVQKQDTKPAAPELSSTDSALFELLRAWRKDRATALDVPAYVVFSDQTLRQIAVSKPKTDDDLAAVHGAGEHKRSKFGADVIRIVSDYIAEHPEADTVSQPPESVSEPARQPSGTCHLSWQMAEKGMSPDAIAEERGLTVGTVIKHLEKGLQHGRDFDLARFVDDAVLQEIDDLLEELGDERLKPIVERSEGRFGYNEARLVRALRNAVQT